MVGAVLVAHHSYGPMGATWLGEEEARAELHWRCAGAAPGGVKLVPEKGVATGAPWPRSGTRWP
jgi:hypothetical protein